MTAVHRNTWTSGRANLIKKVENKESLKVIESSAFAICLDNKEPGSQTDCAKSMILDDGSNRWYDKTIQLIVYKNGRAGLYAEHSLIDGSVITRVLTDSIAPIKGPVEEPKAPPKSLPKKLNFELYLKDEKIINEAVKYYEDFIG